MEAAQHSLVGAARSGQAGLVCRLLKGGSASVDEANDDGWTALMAAVGARHVKIVKALLAAGADPQKATHDDGMNALHVLAERSHLLGSASRSKESKKVAKLMDMLLAARIDPNAPNSAGETALHLFCMRGHLVCTKILLERKLVDVHAANKHGETAFHYASREGHEKVVRLLLAHGASASEPDSATESELEGALNLCDLPAEVIMHVLSYLGDPWDLCTVSRVCRSFAELSRDDKLWRPLGNELWSGHVADEGGWKGAYMSWLRKAIVQYGNHSGIMAVPASKMPYTQTPRNFDYLIRIIIQGERSTPIGKSNLLLRYADNDFVESPISSIGVDFKIKTVQRHGKTLKLQIWDMPRATGRFDRMPIGHYRGAHVALLIYDPTNLRVFDDLPNQLRDLERYAREDIRILLVGTKSDLIAERVVTREEASELAGSWGIPCMECSAKTGEGVNEVFHAAIESAMSGWTCVPGVATPAFIPDESLIASHAPPRPAPLAEAVPQATKPKERCLLQ